MKVVIAARRHVAMVMPVPKGAAKEIADRAQVVVPVPVLAADGAVLVPMANAKPVLATAVDVVVRRWLAVRVVLAAVARVPVVLVLVQGVPARKGVVLGRKVAISTRKSPN